MWSCLSYPLLPSSRCPPLCSKESCRRSTGRSHWASSVSAESRWWRRWWGWRSCRGVCRLCAVPLPLGPVRFLDPDAQSSSPGCAHDGACGGGDAQGDCGGVPCLPSGWLPSCRAVEASPWTWGCSPAQRSWCSMLRRVKRIEGEGLQRRGVRRDILLAHWMGSVLQSWLKPREEQEVYLLCLFIFLSWSRKQTWQRHMDVNLYIRSSFV